MLGDCLTKRPNARKVEQFLAKHLKAKVDSMALDLQIVESFGSLNSRLQARLARIQQSEWSA